MGFADDTFDTTGSVINNNYQQSARLFHYQQRNLQPMRVPHSNGSSDMTINGSNIIGLPMQCNLASPFSMAEQIAQPQVYNTSMTCSQYRYSQQHQRQPIYNQIYQSTQQKHPHQPPFHSNLYASSNNNSGIEYPNAASLQQQLFVNSVHHLQEIDRQNSSSLDFRQEQSTSKNSAPIFTTSMDKSLSSLPNEFADQRQLAISPKNFCVATGTTTIRTIDTQLQNKCQRLEGTSNVKTTTTDPRSKLVDSSSGSSASSSSSSSAPVSATTAEGKLKSYLTHLVLASNIPFAYSIILVAFLITIIASTSIITVLTIILTITGYTAYPVTENTFNTSLTIGVLCASFALALVTASLIVWRRHCQAAYYYLDDPQSASRGTNSPQLSETYDDSEYGSVPVNEWAKHVQKLHVDGDIGFSREFEQIQQANNSNLSYSHSQLPENKHKNRYINIVAYDHTRVTLRSLPGQKKPGFDYINANFIDGYNKSRAYIGTQGPLVSTFDDYWRMIWEQRVVIIVMITNLQERGRRKCDMYWPKEGTETYGHVQVKLLQEVVMATYTLRTFTAKNLKLKKRSGSERTVYQYHYTNWPDHGVPDHPLPVLSFVRKSASANPSGAGAIICHCSAGCGRSGTYIVIDAMLKQIRHRQSINVMDFLKHIRSQRNYLVQTEEQYIFIHDALVEAIESGETEIASNFIAKYIQLLQNGQQQQLVSLTSNGSSKNDQTALSVAAADNVNSSSLTMMNHSQSNNLLLAPNSNSTTANRNSQSGTVGSASAGQWSLLERQYRLVASFKAKDFNVVSALKPCNKIKNRTLNLIPLEAHRVHITPKPGADGSDYINATFLMGFNHLREFIVTQHPVYETFSDFWQMVYDHNSQTIVLLTQMNELLKEFPQFWPQKEDEVDYGSFKVKLTHESTLVKPENGGLIITRDFIMRSNQDDYELQTRLIHCPGWPECCGPLSGVFDLIQVVQNATQQQASQQRLHDGLAASITVTIGQEHEPQNGGPIIVVDKFGGTEAATFAVLTTLFKQINFEDAVDVYMYAKLAHLRRPGIWSSQDDYLFLYRAMENYASSMSRQELANGQNHQSSSQFGSASNLLASGNFHHQTMTLDRHKHKSSSASSSLKTSTMRRSNNNNNSNKQQHQNQPPNFPLSISGKSNNPLLLDHNHNHLISAPIHNNINVSQAANVTMRRNIGNLEHLNSNNNNNCIIMNNSAGGKMNSIVTNNNSSPYNSATSIGTSPHQHLLASNGRNTISSLASNQQQQQQQQQQQPQSVDHYLYPLS